MNDYFFHHTIPVRLSLSDTYSGDTRIWTSAQRIARICA